MKPICRVFIVLGCLLGGVASPFTASAGLLAASTRLIYQEGSREHSLMLANTNDYPVIVQSWIDDGRGDASRAQAPFVVIPPVFRMEPQAKQGVRIVYNQAPLAADRESVWWLNLYEIPPTARANAGENRLLMSMNTQLKIFYRPRSLAPPTAENSIAQLRCLLTTAGTRQAIRCHNPTPYHISFVRLTLAAGGQRQQAAQQMDMMLYPFSDKTYPLTSGGPAHGDKVVAHWLNDDGAMQQSDIVLVKAE